MVRHSCKECHYHLCQRCRAVISVEEMHTEITVRIQKLSAAADLEMVNDATECASVNNDLVTLAVQRGHTTNDLKDLVEERLDVPTYHQTYFQPGVKDPLPGARMLEDGELLYLRVS